MRGRVIAAWVVGLVAILCVLFRPYVIVDQSQQAVITQFGRPVREITEPGLHFKLPNPIQSAVLFDRRLLEYDTEPTVIITQDKKTLVVDNYARWRIVSPTKFLQTVRDVVGAQARLDDIIYSELRVELGRYDLSAIVSSGRSSITDAVTRAVDAKTQEFGIQVVDVRIKKTDLPPENEQAVFERMRTERERQAKQYRAEGEEKAAAIRAEADRQREVLLAEAYRQAQLLRGEGDAEAARIYAAATSEDPEFYAFVRSLEVYGEGLGQDSTVVMGAQSGVMRYLLDRQGGTARSR